MTLLRVFIDIELTVGYRSLFSRAFNLVKECIGVEIKFYYLYGSGIRSIITDICLKQMLGRFYPFSLVVY
jgi:hypothetical protein